MEELQEIIERVTEEVELLGALTLDLVDAICDDRGMTREQFAEYHVSSAKLSREAAAALIRGADALDAALTRLGLIPEPPLWPGFERAGDDWVTTEGGIRFELWHDRRMYLWAACAHDPIDARCALTPRGALESLCASLLPNSPERAAVAAILTRRP